jgi:hypothetical protein
MNITEQVVGEAVRVEYEKETGRLFIVFEITNEKQKKYIMDKWTNDVEFSIMERKLIKND